MNKKKLGNSDLSVSSLCLGTMTYGETTSQEDAHLQINEAIDQGINFIDTAEMYPTCPIRAETTGNTETIIGNWIKNNKSKRDNIVLATKIVGKGFSYVRNGEAINKDNIELALDHSLRRLNTEYVDLYQLHWPNRGSYHFRKYWDYNPKRIDLKNIKEEIYSQLNCLHNLKKKGKIRAIGLSNETCWGATLYANIAKEFEDFFITSIQNEYSLMCRIYDTDLNEFSINENVPLLAYSPLARGLLTGKYLNNKIPKNSRLSRDDKILKIVNERSTKAVRDYIDLSIKYDLDPVHLSLAFCSQRPFMGSVIFGATDIFQLRRILKGKDINLSQEVIKDINELYKKHPLTF
tara:strand:- start:449 stop:1495 length:1047 start_codon:yes stop_codon:yes gene_type:complete